MMRLEDIVGVAARKMKLAPEFGHRQGRFSAATPVFGIAGWPCAKPTRSQ
jgi:hypothetical protein